MTTQGHETVDGYADYHPEELVGKLLVSESAESLPLLYFHSPKEAWSWVMSWFIPGLGMFCEAYFIFSIGNIQSFFTYEYPTCWKSYKNCTANMTRATGYMQIVGVICGMFTLGYVGDRLGRKWGSVLTASFMLVGCILLTVSGVGLNGRGFTIMYIIAQFIFGYGVGGEYPMAAGSAAERAEARGTLGAAKRGREVVLTFSNQGLGNFVNVAVLLVLMVIFDTYVPIHNVKPKTYHVNRLEAVWRTSFALGAIPLLFMLYWRIFKLRESTVWVVRHTGNRKAELALLFKHYWHRLLATGGTWFLVDFSFYGNKIFQGTFIQILSPDASLFVNLLWTLLNSGVALIGYYLSAAAVDNRYLGRVRIQAFGFLMMAILFFVSGIWYHILIKPGGIHVFQFIYFFSSFWTQLGPNCTTYLISGELFPTSLRTTAHGISAGVGKVGALWAAVWFNYVSNRTKFWLTGALSAAGFLLTVLFVPDSLAVSLTEADRRWSFIKAGKTYHGAAVHPDSLSIYERMAGISKDYDPAKDSEDMYRDAAAVADKSTGVKNNP